MKEQEVNLAIPNLVHPLTFYRAFFKSGYFIQFAKDAGYNKIEWHPLQGLAREVLAKHASALGFLKPHLSSAHVHIHPEATFWSVILRKQDPLRPFQKMRLHNLAWVDSKQAVKAIHRLERAFRGNLPVVVYPPFQENPQAHSVYENPMLQPHPPAFEDKSNADQIVESVIQGIYSGVWLDLYHMREKTSDGTKPLMPWTQSIPKLAPYVKGVHFQVGRTEYVDSTIRSQEELKDIFAQYPKMNTEIIQMLKVLKDSGFEGPIIVEVPATALVKLFGLETLTLENLKNRHRTIVEYVKSI